MRLFVPSHEENHFNRLLARQLTKAALFLLIPLLLLPLKYAYAPAYVVIVLGWSISLVLGAAKLVLALSPQPLEADQPRISLPAPKENT